MAKTTYELAINISPTGTGPIAPSALDLTDGASALATCPFRHCPIFLALSADSCIPDGTRQPIGPVGCMTGLGVRRTSDRWPAHECDAENDHERWEQVIVHSRDRSHGFRDIAEHAQETCCGCADADPPD